MYVVTNHFTLLAFDPVGAVLKQVRQQTADGDLQLVEFEPAEVAELNSSQPQQGERGVPITSGPLAGYMYVKKGEDGFHLFNGKFACAPRGMGPLTFDRTIPRAWETFHFVDPESVGNYLQARSQGEVALEARVRARIEADEPVCLHFGCGHNRLEGFLNIDKFAHFGGSDDYFLLDFTVKPWPMPDGSVDYIYSEDFIEHIPQRSQVAFLAEAFRVLKKGAYHRVSTPCLADSMKRHSDFSKGLEGVYYGEFDNHGHICIFTRGLMSDLGLAIGYRQVFFTAKNRGSSPHAAIDRRPGGRNDDTGNIFADLLK